MGCDTPMEAITSMITFSDICFFFYFYFAIDVKGSVLLVLGGIVYSTNTCMESEFEFIVEAFLFSYTF